MKQDQSSKGEIQFYQTSDGTIKLDIRFEAETLWLSQKQIAELFETDRSVITKHIRNIFKTGELEQDQVCAKFAHTASDGKTYTSQFYNLDLIISVGYRVNSKRGTHFRVWSSAVLKEYLLKGYALNVARLMQAQENFSRLESAIAVAKRTLIENTQSDEHTESILELVQAYSHALAILSQYDLSILNPRGIETEHHYVLNIDEAREIVTAMKNELANAQYASDLFGAERDNGLESCVASIYQTFDQVELYPTVEEKAAHLLYFVIKNHPFIDGNKRIGSLLFIHFLKQNRILYRDSGTAIISENALVAIALMIAESNPSERETMLSVTVNLLKKE